MRKTLLLICLVEYLRDKSECCEVGYFGESCSEECPKYCHNNECDRTTGICLSCATGYYRNNDKNKICIQCPGNCAACESETFCFTCKSGFRGTVCKDLCSNCKPNTSCDKITGYCLENCRDGLGGELCDIKCDSKCKSCDRYYQNECTSCEEGASGVLCKENCFSRCLKRSCNDSDESCTFDCSSENWEGKSCNKTCLTYCKESVCNITCKGSSKSNYLILGLVVGSGVVVGSIIVCFIIKRKRICERGVCCSAPSQYSIPQAEGKNDEEDVSLTRPLNPINNGLVNTESSKTPASYPLECTRAKINKGSGHHGSSDTFSTIFVHMNKQTGEYIASFGPAKFFVKGILGDFITLVWQEQSGKIVFLSSIEDKEELQLGESFAFNRQYGDLTVVCKKGQDYNKYCNMKILKIKRQTQERDVALFHFFVWPDRGIPALISRMLEFHDQVKSFTTELTGPTVVYCSGGVHRSATYIAFDILAKENKVVSEDDIRQCIADLHEQNMDVDYNQILTLLDVASITSEKNVAKRKKRSRSNPKFDQTTTANKYKDVSAKDGQSVPMCESTDKRASITNYDIKETEIN